MRLLKIFALVSGMLALMVGAASAQILFEDDFESGEVDKQDKWVGAGSWKAVENAEGEAVLGDFVLDISGGEEGLGIEDFPEDYDYYAHVRSMNGLTGFIFHGQDNNNIYMHQISVTGSSHTPNNTRWHRKVGGAYAAEPEPFQDGVDREQQVWYRAMFEVRGFDFKLYMGDVDAGPDELELVGEWTDSQESFTSGKIGFRMSGAKYAQYDNILVTVPGYDFAVDAGGKLAVTWGGIKGKL